jgi:Chitin synthase
MYRIRTADKGRPIIISNRIIDEYSEPNVDTLHKKNLLSLGEDRFLTTLLMKHFPTFKTKFTQDARAHTVAPESWRVLLSQRRRWINSTVHNLCELILLPELFGFCCFSMRFFVFLDLLGTLVGYCYLRVTTAHPLTTRPDTPCYCRICTSQKDVCGGATNSIFVVGLPHRHCFYWTHRLSTHLGLDDCVCLWTTGEMESNFLYPG